jgi:hypothetical protein
MSKKTPKPKRFTIWRYMVEFHLQQDLFHENVGWEEREGVDPLVVYSGPASGLTDELAERVAELHPGCLEYSRDAMATLYKLHGSKRGIESPSMSVLSLCPWPYLVIRRLFDDPSMYPGR